MSFGTHMSPLSINKQHSNGSSLLNDVRTLPSKIQQRKIMAEHCSNRISVSLPTAQLFTICNNNKIIIPGRYL